MNNILLDNYISYYNTWKNLTFRADIHLIWWCNFKCIMCDNWKREIEMEFEHEYILKLILSLKKDYNCNYIRFHWQEPTIYNKLEELILFSKKLWLKVAIKTNGRLLSNKRLITILKYWLDDLYLSIDWPDPEIHDKIRWVKWSFDKNIDIIIKAKKINPNLKIYINSVVMKGNFNYLDKMVDFWKKYNLDRVSFVFLNDKNRKDIYKINLSKEEFNYFFYNKVLQIYEKSKKYNITVDFSPFISELTWKNNDEIIEKLKNIVIYEKEINYFYNWLYWKIFYDKYWCFWPIDHCSINYNWDIYGCCVVERDRKTSVWNVIENNIVQIKNSEKYEKYRKNSNYKCSYASKCASNFYTRKSLFKDIYLDNNLYDKNNPQNYYRYLKELFFENQEIVDQIKLKKLKNILLYFYNNLPFYKKLLEQNNIYENDIRNISDLLIIKKLPILDKNILKNNYEEIKKLYCWNNILKWKTSWNSWNSLDFFYPLDFKRYIKQIAIFSLETDFTYNDSFFSITPINCNQKIINNINEPDYVKKIYISIFNFDFDKEYLQKINKIFIKNKQTKFLHWDSKYILYLIIWLKKYWIKLPKLKGIFLTYSYTNKSLKEYIKKSFWCNIYDNYWCSEVWPITVEIFWEKKIFWNNILFEEINNEFIISDLDNYYFPFLRYKNWDLWNYDWKYIEIYWKQTQKINWKNLIDIDNFFYYNFREILIYQFIWKNFYYISTWNIKKEKLSIKIKIFFDINFNINRITENEFLKIWNCSKFKIIKN